MNHNLHQENLHNPSLLLDCADSVARIIETIRATESVYHIAVCGMSGAVVGGLVSAFCELPLTIIRKESDVHHSSYNVQGCSINSEKSYVIVDDLIDSGKTIRLIADKLEKELCRCVGIIVYCEEFDSYTERAINNGYFDWYGTKIKVFKAY